jgi:hypothetical protein
MAYRFDGRSGREVFAGKKQKSIIGFATLFVPGGGFFMGDKPGPKDEAEDRKKVHGADGCENEVCCRHTLKRYRIRKGSSVGCGLFFPYGHA